MAEEIKKEVKTPKKATVKKTATKKTTETTKKVATKKPAVKATKEEKELVVEEVLSEAVVEEKIPSVNEVKNNEKSETINEINKEETPVIEVEVAKKEDETLKKEETAYPTHMFKNIDLTFDSTEDAYNHIENSRKEFYSYYKKNRRTSSIYMGLIFLFLILGIIMITIPALKNISWLVYVYLGVLAVLFIAMLFVNSRTKKQFKDKTDTFVQDYLESIDAAVFKDEDFAEVKQDRVEKLVPQEFIDAHLYDTINVINSRERVEGKLFGYDFFASDVAAKIPSNADPKKEVLGFYGKFIGVEHKFLPFDVIMVLRGEKVPAPNYLDGYNLVDGLDLSSFDVYATDQEKAKIMLTSTVLEPLRQLEVNENLLGLSISINDSGTRIALSYDDNLMVLPIQKDFTIAPLIEYKLDVSQVVSFLKLLDNLKA